MSNIHLRPGKAKPKELRYPCSECPRWEEDKTGELDTVTKELLNPGLRAAFLRCKFHPWLGDPHLRSNCPYSELLGKTLIYIDCDACGKVIEEVSPDDPRLPSLLSNPNQTNLCPDCQKKDESSLVKFQRPPTIIKVHKEKPKPES